MTSGAKKASIVLGAALALFIAIVLGAAVFLGVFQTVAVEAKTAGPYRIAYLPHTGPYHETRLTIERVAEELKRRDIRFGDAVGIYFDDPAQVPAGQLRSRGGVLVPDEAMLPESVREEIVPPRLVAAAQFHGSPMIGALKVYPKMAQWMSANRYVVAGPALEVYRGDGVVEYQFPIAPK